MNTDKQKLLLSYVLGNEDIFTRTNSIIKSSYFDPELRQAITFVKEYFEKYHALPNHDQLKAETGVAITVKELPKHESDYATDQVEGFCRNKAIEGAILQGPGLLEAGDYGQLEKVIKDAISVGLNKDIGLDYFANPEDRLKRMLLNQQPLSTGWYDIDSLLNGGVNRKEMTLFMANSGVGKSIVMSNLGVNFIERKYNVLYITLELSEDVVAKRFDSMITGVSQSEIFSKMQKVASDVVAKGEIMGKLVVKRFPESSTCANDVRAYLKEFELLKGYIPDVIIIDYLDLMTTNHKISVENLFVKDKYVTEEIRSIANDYNCVMITASQMGRGALDATEHHQGHIQGGISKVNTTDNLIAILQTEAMKAGGEYVLKMIKTRSSGGVGKQAVLAWNPIALRVTDLNGQRTQIELIKKSDKSDMFTSGNNRTQEIVRPTKRDITSLMNV